MGFAYDLFISYSHIDNEPIANRDGWITQFHRSLFTFLSQLKGSKAQIWRDIQLQGNHVFPKEILDQFGQTAVLVTVVTPAFLNSEWCAREVDEFCRRAEQSGGIVLGNKSRIFKVEKTAVETQMSLPPAMRDAIGYRFYINVEGNNLELEPHFGESYAQQFLIGVRLLAGDIVKLLKMLPSQSGDAGTGHQTNGKAIYLAESSEYQGYNRRLIQQELARQGYLVLPDRALPSHEQQYASEVQSMLKRCELSIHIVDDHYGPVLTEPSQKSVVMLQNELAIQRSETVKLPRLIWLPSGASPKDERQQAFIEALHSDPRAQFGADLIKGTIEELKTAIRETLKKPAAPVPDAAAGVADSAKPEAATPNDPGVPGPLYLICDNRDVKATVPIRKFFGRHGYEIEIPVFEGSAGSVRETNEQLLKSCIGVILFYGAGDEPWKRSKQGEMKKMAGSRGGHSRVPSLIYLADPWTDSKQDVLDVDESALDGRGEFSEAALESFLQTIKANGVVQ